MSLLVLPGLCCIVLGIQAAFNIRGAAERWAKRNRDEDPRLVGPLRHGGQSLPIVPRTTAAMRIVGALVAVAGVALVVVGMSGE